MLKGFIQNVDVYIWILDHTLLDSISLFVTRFEQQRCVVPERGGMERLWAFGGAELPTILNWTLLLK